MSETNLYITRTYTHVYFENIQQYSILWWWSRKYFHCFSSRFCLGAIMSRFKDKPLRTAEEAVKRWLNTSGQRKWDNLRYPYIFYFNLTFLLKSPHFYALYNYTLLWILLFWLIRFKIIHFVFLIHFFINIIFLCLFFKLKSH